MLVNKLSRSQRLLIVIAISFLFFIAEIGVGFYTRALVLVADAFHYLTDLIGYVVAFIAVKFAERENSPKLLSFGWQRATLLGAFFNGVFLLALGVSIFLQAIERFVSIERIENPRLVLIVGGIGLALNLVCAVVIHEHPHEGLAKTSVVDLRGRVPSASQHEDHRHNTTTDQHKSASGGHDFGIMGVMLHILGDALNNIGVIIAAAVIWKTHYEGRFYADPAVSMGIAIMIMVSSVPLMKGSGKILMQSAPADIDPDDVKHDLETLPGVVAVHDLHIWQLNQEKALATAHMVVSDEAVSSMDDFMKLAATVNECLHAYGIHSTTLQPEKNLFAVGNETCGPADAGSDKVDQNGHTNPAPCSIGCRMTTCSESTCCD